MRRRRPCPRVAVVTAIAASAALGAAPAPTVQPFRADGNATQPAGTDPPAQQPAEPASFLASWSDEVSHAGMVHSIATSLRGTVYAVGTAHALYVYRIDWYLERGGRGLAGGSRRPGVARMSVDLPVPRDLQQGSEDRGADPRGAFAVVRTVALSAEADLMAAGGDHGVVWLWRMGLFGPRQLLATLHRPAAAKGARLSWSYILPDEAFRRVGAVALSAGGDVLVAAWGATVAVYAIGNAAPRDGDPFPAAVHVSPPQTLDISDHRDDTGRIAALIHGVALSGDGQLLTVSAGDSAVRGLQLRHDRSTPIRVPRVACVWSHYTEGLDFVVFAKVLTDGGGRETRRINSSDLGRGGFPLPFPPSECLSICSEISLRGALCTGVEVPTATAGAQYCGLWLNGRCRSASSPGLTPASNYDLYLFNLSDSPSPQPQPCGPNCGWDSAMSGQFDPCRPELRSTLYAYSSNMQQYTCNKHGQLYRGGVPFGTFRDTPPQRPLTQWDGGGGLALLTPDRATQLQGTKYDPSPCRQDGTAMVTTLEPFATTQPASDMLNWTGFGAYRVRSPFAVGSTRLSQDTMFAQGSKREVSPESRSFSVAAAADGDTVALVEVQAKGVKLQLIRARETDWGASEVALTTDMTLSVGVGGAAAPAPRARGEFGPDDSESAPAEELPPLEPGDVCALPRSQRTATRSDGTTFSVSCGPSHNCAGVAELEVNRQGDCPQDHECRVSGPRGVYGPVRDYSTWYNNPDRYTAATPEWTCQPKLERLHEGDVCLGSSAFPGGGSLLDRSAECPTGTVCTLNSTYDTHKGSWLRYDNSHLPGQPTYRCLRPHPIAATAAVSGRGEHVALAISAITPRGAVFPPDAGAHLALRAVVRPAAIPTAAPSIVSYPCGGYSSSGSAGIVHCADSFRCITEPAEIAAGDAGACCAPHGGVLRCPPEAPVMCKSTACGGGTVNCCATDCAAHGGPKPCPRPSPWAPRGPRYEASFAPQPAPLGPAPRAAAVTLGLGGRPFAEHVQWYGTSGDAKLGKPLWQSVKFPGPIDTAAADIAAHLMLSEGAVSEARLSDGEYWGRSGVVATFQVGIAFGAAVKELEYSLEGSSVCGVAVSQRCRDDSDSPCWSVYKLDVVAPPPPPPPPTVPPCRRGTRQVDDAKSCTHAAGALGITTDAMPLPEVNDSALPRCFVDTKQQVIWNPAGAAATPSTGDSGEAPPRFLYAGKGRKCSSRRQAGRGVVGFRTLPECAAECARPEAQGCEWFALANVSTPGGSQCVLCSGGPDEGWPTQPAATFYAMAGTPWWVPQLSDQRRPAVSAAAEVGAAVSALCASDKYTVLAQAHTQCSSWGLYSVATPTACVAAMHYTVAAGHWVNSTSPLTPIYGGFIRQDEASADTPLGCFVVGGEGGRVIFRFNPWARGGTDSAIYSRVCTSEQPSTAMYSIPSWNAEAPGDIGLPSPGLYYPAPILYGVCFSLVGLCLLWGAAAYYVQFVRNRAGPEREPALEEELVERHKLNYQALMDRLQVDIDPEGTNEDCSVCLEPLCSEGDTCVCLPCCHKFHHKCLLEYVQYQVEKRRKRHPRCPNCRGRIPLDAELPPEEEARRRGADSASPASPASPASASDDGTPGSGPRRPSRLPREPPPALEAAPGGGLLRRASAAAPRSAAEPCRPRAGTAGADGSTAAMPARGGPLQGRRTPAGSSPASSASGPLDMDLGSTPSGAAPAAPAAVSSGPSGSTSFSSGGLAATRGTPATTASRRSPLAAATPQQQQPHAAQPAPQTELRTPEDEYMQLAE